MTANRFLALGANTDNLRLRLLQVPARSLATDNSKLDETPIQEGGKKSKKDKVAQEKEVDGSQKKAAKP